MEMQDIVTGNFAPPRWMVSAPKSLRILDWNIDRGQQLQGVTDFLVGVNADILILQEVDLNARRTHRLNIAETIARKLEMNYVFGREFQELVQGSKDSPAYHGQATLSKWPISEPRLSTVTLLEAPLVSAEVRAVSGATRRKNRLGSADQRRWQKTRDLQPSSGEPWK
jgi:exonuclease III